MDSRTEIKVRTSRCTIKRAVVESLTVLLRRCGWYVRYGKRLYVASIRRFFLHGDVLPALISRLVYLSIPTGNTQDFALRNFAEIRIWHLFLIRSCKRLLRYCQKKNKFEFPSDLPEATVRTDLEEIAVLTVRDRYRGGLILGMITAIVSRAIARLLLHVRT